MEIIEKRRTELTVSYTLHYEGKNTPGSGYSFDCDKDGNVSEETKKHPAWVYVQECRDQFQEPHIGVCENRFPRAARGKCDVCGEIVVLGNPLDNYCPQCGACYNMTGSRVIPSDQCDEQGEPLDY